MTQNFMPDFTSRLRYNKHTGDLLWLSSNNHVRIGAKAGWLNHDGYRVLEFSGRSYMAHVVAWAITTGKMPELEIDHINGNRADNRWENLRLATRLQNAKNRTKLSTNKAGCKGVSFLANREKWRARIQADGVPVYLGLFKTKEEAVAAYNAAANKLHGDFARLEAVV